MARREEREAEVWEGRRREGREQQGDEDSRERRKGESRSKGALGSEYYKLTNLIIQIIPIQIVNCYVHLT